MNELFPLYRGSVAHLTFLIRSEDQFQRTQDQFQKSHHCRAAASQWPLNPVKNVLLPSWSPAWPMTTKVKSSALVTAVALGPRISPKVVISQGW